jgi:hypothetical protein
MFPTQADYNFWSVARAPQWARVMMAEREARQRRLSWGRPDAAIHACINSHAGLRSDSWDMSAHNLCMLVRSARKRGEDIRKYLRGIATDPGTVINPQQRSRFARKWLARLEERRHEGFARRDNGVYVVFLPITGGRS